MDNGTIFYQNIHPNFLIFGDFITLLLVSILMQMSNVWLLNKKEFCQARNLASFIKIPFLHRHPTQNVCNSRIFFARQHFGLYTCFSTITQLIAEVAMHDKRKVNFLNKN